MELTKIRPSDIVWTVLLAGLGVLLMVADINAGPHSSTRIDSHSWALVPVFLLAVAPVLWRRTDAVLATAASTVAMGVHDVAFGSLVRCGAGLPLSFVLAYSVGRLVHPSRRSAAGMGFVVALQAAVLIRDTAAGIGILPFTVIIGLAAFGTGALVRRRQGRRLDTSSTPELSYV